MHNVVMDYQVFMQKFILENVFCVHLCLLIVQKKHKTIKMITCGKANLTYTNSESKFWLK